MAGPKPADPEGAERLTALLARIRACRLCVEAPRGAPLPHAPRPVLRAEATARLLVAGQAPGTKVHASGTPFLDRSGDRLRDWMGIDPATFYDTRRIAIVPMGFCFPGQDARGGDLPPRRECAPAWRAAVMAELPALELVLAIGLPAIRWHLGPDARETLTATVSAFAAGELPARTPLIIPLPHPSWRNTAWLKHNPWFYEQLLPRLRATVARVLSAA
ncbi:uracil-DNA glycosylase family protein [Segnochrobactraceae bacterium EtOH-i3]